MPKSSKKSTKKKGSGGTPCLACNDGKLYPRINKHRQYCKSALLAAKALSTNDTRVEGNTESGAMATPKDLEDTRVDLMSTDQQVFDDNMDIEVEPIVEVSHPVIEVPLSQSGRPTRTRKLPARFDDFQISTQSAVRRSVRIPVESASQSHSTSPAQSRPNSPLGSTHVSRSPSPAANVPLFISKPGSAGLFRIHRYFAPMNDPEVTDGSDVANSSEVTTRSPDSVFGQRAKERDRSPEVDDDFAPHANISIALLMQWHYTTGGLAKSRSNLDKLVHEVLLDPRFKVEDLFDFRARRECALLDRYNTSKSKDPDGLPIKNCDNWMKGVVEIPLPRARQKISEGNAPTLTVGNIQYRPPFQVITNEIRQPHAANFRWKPFLLFYQPPDPSRPILRVYGEGYTSDRMLEFEEEVFRTIKEKELKIDHEIGIVSINLYSDSTLLANFGGDSIWPMYMTFQNWSKYSRLKPSSHAMNHIAYFPSLPETVQKRYKEVYDQLATEPELRFCKVELLQAVLFLLFSDENFIEAYRNGCVQECADGILRHLFYRFFCYSADYVERVMLVCIKYLSKHPCALCLTEKDDVHKLGLVWDMKKNKTLVREDTERLRNKIAIAREFIFNEGKAVAGERVQNLLGDYSALPIFPSLSYLFQQDGLNHYSMHGSDSFHDITGRVSDLLKQNIQLLNALGKKSEKDELNDRYRMVPTFGKGTIRRFKGSFSKFKKFAGRDYEDALQCAMPCFEGLFPNDEGLDTLLQDLLFTFSTWVSYCNLRQHTDSTVATFKSETKELGRLFRKFIKATKGIKTLETEGELEARLHNDANGDRDPRPKGFSLYNYKTHALRHYPDLVSYMGTADGFNTQAGEREHRRVKQLYGITNKNANYEQQIAQHVSRQRKLEGKKTQAKGIPKEVNREELPPDDPSLHHQISGSEKTLVYFQDLVMDDPDDPLIANMENRLREHILSRILNADVGTEFTEEDLHKISIVSQRMFKHRQIRIHYTTYDLRREDETITPRRRPHIMLLANEPGGVHPYQYARVLGIYHVRFMYINGRPPYKTQKMEFLFVRWFQFDTTYRSGWKAKRLPRLHFYKADDPDAFGFVDPAVILRASHLIPAFKDGKTKDYLPSGSLVRVFEEFNGQKYVKEKEDWRYYYVNMFPDRDMFMRYRGGGIGHQKTDVFTRKAEEEATRNDGPLPVYNERGECIDQEAGVDGKEDEEDDEEEDEEDGDEIDELDEERYLLEKLEMILELELDDEDEDEDDDDDDDDDYDD